MIAVLKDGLRAPNAVFSEAGWGALVLTACVVLAAFAVIPALAEVHAGIVIVLGGAVQLVFTVGLAGFRQRQSS